MSIITFVKESKKNVDVFISNKKEIVKELSLVKNIETRMNFIISNFANIAGIGIKSTIEFTANILLKISKKFSISSKNSFISTMGFLSKKSLKIDAKTSFKASVDMYKEMSFGISSDIEFINRKEAILSTIDGIVLSDLDIKTLGELGFSDGLRFILEKRVNVTSTQTFATTVSVLMYYYNRLSDYDTDTLLSMDSVTLDNLDRILV